MIKPKFEFKNDWESFEKLYQDLSVIYNLKIKYDQIREVEKDPEFDKLLRYLITASNEHETIQSLAKAANELIVNYVTEEES
jgi:hypothetical protein